MFRKYLPTALSKLALHLYTFITFHQNHWWETKVFTAVILTYAITLGTLFTFWIPPFIKPDETAHFFRTISISQGSFLCETKNNVLALDLPKFITAYPLKISLGRYSDSIRYMETQKAEKIIQDEQHIACTLPFIPYLFTGIVLAPFVWLQTNPEFIFFFGRFLNMIISLSVLMAAYFLTPKKLRLLPSSVLLLPMTWHQVSSFSKDSMHIAFGVLGISLVLSFLNTTERISYKQIALCITSLVIAIIARPQYAPLILLAYLIPKDKIASRISLFEKLHFWQTKRKTTVPKYGRLLIVLILLAIIGISIKYNFYTVPASKLGQTPNYEIADANAQMNYMLTTPSSWFTVPYYTFIHRGQYLLETMIGSLGSFDIFFDWYVYTILVIFFGLTSYWSHLFVPKLRNGELALLTFSIIGSMMGILLAMYLYATPVGNLYVSGIQGRYFILLLPLVLWWIAELRRRYTRAVDVALFLVIIISIVKMTISYY